MKTYTLFSSMRTMLLAGVFTFTLATAGYAQNDFTRPGTATELPSLNPATGSHEIGLRFGGYSGINYRYWNLHHVGFEASLSGLSRNNGLLISVLLEKQLEMSNGFSAYLGAGPFLGSYNYNRYYYRFDGERYEAVTSSGTILGLETVIGCDYHFAKVPVAIGLDVKPRFFQFVYPDIWDIGVSARYIIR